MNIFRDMNRKKVDSSWHTNRVMSARKRFLLLVVIMIVACTLAVLVITVMLYQYNVTMQRKMLQVSVQSQARLIEAVARNQIDENIVLPVSHTATDVFESTLAQIIDAHEHYAGFGNTGEFTLARKEGNDIVFLVRHRLAEVEQPEPVAFDSMLAEPMHLALEGKSGTVIGLDYRGELVLAAYEPVADLNLGIVAKIDMGEIRAPFIRAVFSAVIVVLVVVLLGTGLFFKVSAPIIARLESYARDLETEVEERRRSEEELRESEAFLERVMQFSPFAMWVADAQGNILKVNQALCRILHQPAENIEGKYNVLEDENLKEQGVLSQIQAVFDDLEPCRFSILWKGHKAGRVDLGATLDIVIDASLFPIINNEGKLTHVVCQWVDITEQKCTEKELVKYRDNLEELVQQRTTQLDERMLEAEHLNRAMVNLMEDLQDSNSTLETTSRALMISNRELDAFSYSVSHDLRAPLRHIDGFVGLLMKRVQDTLDATSLRYLHIIVDASQRMGRLIDDLLAFARTGRAEMCCQCVDSNELVRNTCKELLSLTEGRDITWQVSDLPMVYADQGLLRLVWDNLIGNAIKYTRTQKQACIEIGTRLETSGRDAEEITFFIRDNGVGFNPEYVHKLFGVFQRLHREDEFEGTGIGLATVRRIIQRHGGRVWAEGEVGHGAVFYFTLNKAPEEERTDEGENDSAGG